MRPRTTWTLAPAWRAVCHRARLAGEAGMATAEYVAVITLMCLLVLVVAPADIARPVTDSIRAAFCLLSGDDCSGETPLTDEDFMPTSCNRSTKTYKGEIGVSIAFFDVKGGLTFARTERSDGKVSFTIVDSAGVGATAEIGAEAEFGVAKVGVSAEARAGIDVKIGDTWVVDAGKADDVQARLMGGEALEKTIGGKIPVFGKEITDWAANRIWGDLGDPDITFIAAGASGKVGAKSNLELWEEQVAGASIEGAAALLIGTEYDRSAADPKDHTATRYIQADLSANGGVSWVAGGFEGKLESSSIIKAKKNAEGELIQLEVVTSMSAQELGMVGSNLPKIKTLLKGAQKGTVVETTTIPLESPEERAVGQQWIDDLGGDPDALNELARAKGRYTVQNYNTDDITLALGAKVAAGVKLGGRGEIGMSDQQLVDAHFLGAPDSSGRRDLVPFTACTEG